MFEHLAPVARTALPSCFCVLLLSSGCGDDDVTGTDAGAFIDVDGGDPSDGGAPDDGGAAEDAFVPTDAGMPDAFVPLPEELELEEGEAPIDVPEGTFFTTVSYGESTRQVFDAFLPDSEEPTPAVLYFHGGGFVAGSRTSIYDGAAADGLAALVEAGVAYITVDYSLLVVGTETEGVIRSLRDARRALQFVRYYATAFNVDPERIGLLGSSAGAGTSLWLAFHDDMAEPGSDDPIARQSTRVQAALVGGTQSTYDLLRWPTDVYSPTYPLTVDELLGEVALAAQVVTFYGLPASLLGDPDALRAELESEEYTAYRDDLDMLDLMTSDDPPFLARNSGADRAPDDSRFDILHHPLHVQALADRAAEVELEGAVLEAPALELGGMESSIGFLREHLDF